MTNWLPTRRGVDERSGGLRRICSVALDLVDNLRVRVLILFIGGAKQQVDLNPSIFLVIAAVICDQKERRLGHERARKAAAVHARAGAASGARGAPKPGSFFSEP